MTDAEKIYFLGFSAFPGIGPLRFKLLLQYLGSAKRAWEASGKELLEIGLGEKITYKFIDFRKNFSLTKYLGELKDKKIRFITGNDESYPKLLKEITDAPFVLYIRGDKRLDWDLTRTIAIVGTRQVTSYGREITRRIVEELVDAQLIIVSGMAYGVDTIVHETAIESGGLTIAVLGCGVDVIHPVSNTKLYWKIVKEKGRVVSEFPPGLRSTKGLFPARNRIISGLSLGVVVTEGAEDSGALITARYAAEQGREVFAVPGPITSRYSKAPTILLKQGAKLVTEANDILEELNLKFQNSRLRQGYGGQASQISKQNLSEEERTIVQLLENENLHIDEIVRKSGIEAAKVGGILTMLEMRRIVKNTGGGVYSYFPA